MNTDTELAQLLGEKIGPFGECTEYSKDLNLVHRAYVKLIQRNTTLEDAYSYFLGVECSFGSDYLTHPDFSISEWCEISNATAEQRAKALLATLKWKAKQ